MSIDKSASVVIISRSEKVILPAVSESTTKLTSATSPVVLGEAICSFKASIRFCEDILNSTSYFTCNSLNPTVPFESLPTVKIISVISTPYSSTTVSPSANFSSRISLSESFNDLVPPVSLQV